MTQLPKYSWLIETIRRAGKISHKDLSEKWELNKELSDYKPLHRTTFNRWREAIAADMGIVIACQRKGGYLYYIENPEVIDENQVQKWMLDSMAVSNIINDNLSIKDRILVEAVPSGHDHLTAIMEAMKESRTLMITYKPFNKSESYHFPIEPYCVKLFEGRWYVLAHNIRYDDTRIYGLDRIEEAQMTEDMFKLPKDFSAADYFSNYYGIYTGDHDQSPERVIIRANRNHKHYMMTLPLHHSQQLIEDCGEYADFELYLVPTYDFVMKLLHVGGMIEVMQPASLRRAMKGWISEMNELYKND